jgi:hypothetical protein
MIFLLVSVCFKFVRVIRQDTSVIINDLEHLGGDVGGIFADTSASSLLGALYLWPVGFAFWKKINNLLPIVIAVGAALATLVVRLIAIPALLSITTSGFAIASAGTSAIAVAKSIRYIVVYIQVS